MIDGKRMPRTLMEIVKAPLDANPNNSVIAFKDNSSAIRGGIVHPLLPSHPGQCSPLDIREQDWDVLLTAETHNFPCAVAPCPARQLPSLLTNNWRFRSGDGCRRENPGHTRDG